MLTFLMSLLNPPPKPEPIQGDASYYARSFIDKTMSNGRPYRPEHLTMATWEFPLGTRCRVTYHSRGGSVRTVVVTVTDRGPAKHLVAKGRRFDLSWSAFRALENHKVGVIRVTVEVLSSDELTEMGVTQ